MGANPADPLDAATLFAANEAERYNLHTRHMNEQMVRVLKTIGYDVGFTKGQGQYLYDRNGEKYLDLLSGFGVFALGRNHPDIREALKSVLDSDLPNLVQMDVSTLAGILAKKLLDNVPSMEKVFFANSGAEAVEAAIKFARAATGKPNIVFCDHAFHGLTHGALSLNGDAIFRTGFEPLLGGCIKVPFDDLAALEQALATKQVGAFIVEPVQGKGVNVPSDGYLKAAADLCRKHGALFIADEIQTGLGRTGKFLAIEHWGVEPDMVLLAKSLSGGHVPVGAVLTRKWIFDKLFDRMDRAVVHGSTFSKNDLAMAAGIATLDVMKRENVVENAARMGDRILSDIRALIPKWEMLKEVRGKGLMIGIEFGPPKSLSLKPGWHMMEAANKGLFCQLITIPLFKEHHVLSQVAGHGMQVVKFLPPLIVNEDDCKWIAKSLDQVIGESHSPGAFFSLGKTLAGHALKARSSAA